MISKKNYHYTPPRRRKAYSCYSFECDVDGRLQRQWSLARLKANISLSWRQTASGNSSQMKLRVEIQPISGTHKNYPQSFMDRSAVIVDKFQEDGFVRKKQVQRFSMQSLYSKDRTAYRNYIVIGLGQKLIRG